MTSVEQTGTYVYEYRELPATGSEVHPFYQGLLAEVKVGSKALQAVQEVYS